LARADLPASAGWKDADGGVEAGTNR
jgi:hypothetical protein